MKKNLILLLTAAAGCFNVEGQLLNQHYNSITPGYDQAAPVDVRLNSFNLQYSTLHNLVTPNYNNSTGMGVVQYDASSGGYMGSISLITNSGMPIEAIKIVHDGTYSNILLRMLQIDPDLGTNLWKLAVCRYNNASNTLVWCRYLTDAADVIEVTPKDIVVDGVSGDIYVAGDFAPNSANVDMFLCKISSAGVIQYFQQYSTANNETVYNLNFNSGELYMGAGVNANTTSGNALVFRIKTTNGSILAANRIVYSASCPGVKINGVCVKRNGSRLFMTCTSSAFTFFVAQLDPTTLAVIGYKVHDTYPTDLNPYFNFVNAGGAIALNGLASPANASSAGLSTFLYNVSTFGFISEYRYTSLSTAGNVIVNDVNTSSNELFTLAEDDANPLDYLIIKTSYNGDLNACSELFTHSLLGCSLIQARWANVYIQPAVIFPDLQMTINEMDHSYVDVCNPCPSCERLLSSVEPQSAAHRASVDLYPNPAENSLKIVGGAGNLSLSSIAIYDLQNRLMKNYTGLQGSEATLDLTGLETGVYVAKIQLLGGSLRIEKFMKR